jgi:hypothetical protein
MRELRAPRGVAVSFALFGFGAQSRPRSVDHSVNAGRRPQTSRLTLELNSVRRAAWMERAKGLEPLGSSRRPPVPRRSRAAPSAARGEPKAIGVR